MTSDVRAMRDLRAAGHQYGAIAEALGVCVTTVVKYAGDVEPDRSVLVTVQEARAGMAARSLRYRAFVERAAAFVPLLVPNTPF